MKESRCIEWKVNCHRYRIAAQSVWDPVRGRSVARQVVLGPATSPPVADLRATRTVGTDALGGVGALIWLPSNGIRLATSIENGGKLGAKAGPSVGELAVAFEIESDACRGRSAIWGNLDASVRA